MKLTNANKLISAFSAILFTLTSCQYRSESELIIGPWKYVSITRQDSIIINISDEDYFQINADSTFKYAVHSVKKHKSGQWTYNDQTLHLKYLNPDTLRHFKINLISNHDLEMQEGNVIYKFKKVHTD